MIFEIFSVSLIKNESDDCESEVDVHSEKDGNLAGVLGDGDCATRRRIGAQVTKALGFSGQFIFCVELQTLVSIAFQLSH